MILFRSNTTFAIAVGAALLAFAAARHGASPQPPARNCSANTATGAPTAPRPAARKSASRSPSRRRPTTNPPSRPRDPAYLFVSTRPAEKVKEEISVIIGYPFKSNSDATIEVGATNFALYTQNDGAWIKNAAEEARMLEAMRKGADLTVKGESGRGTKTTDMFSLKGIAQALDRAAQECK